MYRIAVCDDEQEAREEIVSVAKSIVEEMQVDYCIHQYSDPERLMEQMEMTGAYDVLLLDILLCGANGVDFARTLREKNIDSGIILISNSQEYILEGYDVQAVKYILKPIQREQLSKAMQYDYTHRHKNRTVSFQQKGEIFSFAQKELIFLEYERRKIKIRLQNGTCEILSGKLSEFETVLPSDQFCRCHISFLVNLEYVRKASRKGVELEDGTVIPMGRSFYKAFQQKMLKYFS